MLGTVCLQFLLRVASSSVMKSRNGFECSKKIRLKLRCSEENVKLHRKGTDILRDASVSLANGVSLVIRNRSWQHYQNRFYYAMFLTVSHPPPGQHFEMK